MQKIIWSLIPLLLCLLVRAGLVLATHAQTVTPAPPTIALTLTLHFSRGRLVMKTFSQGTDTWKKITEGMTITAYGPPLTSKMELDVVEPGEAVHLSAADRARMNRAKPGVRTKSERL
jgi:hypothetical protein